MSYPIWSKEEIAYLKQNYLSMQYADIALQLNRTVDAVKRRVHMLKLPLKYQRVPIKHEYFDQIDNCTKAYLLGFIAADGYVTPCSSAGCSTISFALRQEDDRIVQLLRDKIAPGKRLYYRENMARLDVTSEHMVLTLINRYNIKVNRKATLTIPSLPVLLAQSFILGFFDGDGWITRSKDCSTWTWGLQSGKPLLDNISRYFVEHLNIDLTPRTYESWPQPDWMFRIMAHAKNARAIDEWLHGCNLGLSRKSIVWRESSLR